MNGERIERKGKITADALSAYDCLFGAGSGARRGLQPHGLRTFRDDKHKRRCSRARRSGSSAGSSR